MPGSMLDGLAARDPRDDSRLIRDELDLLADNRIAHHNVECDAIIDAFETQRPALLYLPTHHPEAVGVELELAATPSKFVPQPGAAPHLRVDVQGFRSVSGVRTMVFEDTCVIANPGVTRWEDVPTRWGENVNSIEDPVVAFLRTLGETVATVTRDGRTRFMLGQGDVLTATGETEDVAVHSDSSSSWPTIRDGNSLAISPYGTTASFDEVGFEPTWAGYQFFAVFDTSSIGTNSIDSTVYKLVGRNDWSTNDFNFQCINYDAGTIAAADWRTRAQLNSLTVMSSLGSASLGEGTRVSFTTDSEATWASHINKTGDTVFVLISDDNKDASAPAGEARYQIYTGNGGSTEQPHLVVTHSAGGGGLSIPIAMHHYKQMLGVN